MAETRFDAALDREPVARRLGDVRLRYDAELLIGERVPSLDAPALIPDALVLTGMAAAVVALCSLVIPGLSGGLWGTLAAAAISAAATVAGLRMGGLRRGRRGFAVNFDQHVIRIDRPGGLRIRTATTLVPFAEVTAVLLLERGPGQSALAVAARDRPWVLVDAVPDQDRAQLERLRRMLEAAVGLIPPAGA
ncbi:MAG TPA: hypothetical protein VND93_06185 [Myxococcales bacterium]|jgi:hypothetical protein|nr:hypothetical protein [Myxococcales bacterium]